MVSRPSKWRHGRERAATEILLQILWAMAGKVAMPETLTEAQVEMGPAGDGGSAIGGNAGTGR